MLDVGEKPADFELQDQQGNTVAWSSLRGRKVVFFFYPKADTPGCTKEACAFRDLRAAFEAKGVAVYGVSGDSVKRQSSFDTKYGLGLPLLADPDRSLLEAWGVLGEKKMYGKTVKGIIRSTFLFDEDGAVVKRWSPVKVDGHADAVLAAV
ncbi:MAG: peroxiredoxin [Alphaproteobacteria bacterium]|nr:peroxiredoxin [Alphaproteobacteria bacterium]MCB9699253.1 peroxiredoxin [Alphaproteobacteria bacterium]